MGIQKAARGEDQIGSGGFCFDDLRIEMSGFVVLRRFT
jgi:hypothetical protein